jgi:CsoR family transcriptional regulator, copper-sensing transcriptional repressor
MIDTQRRLARLRTIEGHLRGVQRMEREGAYCIDLIKQTQAIQAALDKFNALVLEHHLATCVTDAIRSDDQAERERVVGELLQVYGREDREIGDDQPADRFDELQQAEADVRQLAQLVGDDAYCIAIITGGQRVKATLHRYNSRVLADHLRGCVTDAIRGSEAADRERKLGELLQLFTTSNTVQVA